MSKNPFQTVMELQPERRRRIIVTWQPFPEEVEDSSVDAICALRATLDYAGFAAARALGCAHPRSCYFPFADTNVELENTIKGRCRDLHPRIVELFRSFEPYQGGRGEALWALNKLRQKAEHAAVTRAEFRIENGLIHVSGGAPPDSVQPYFSFDREKHEVVVAEVGPERPHTNYSFQFTIHIAFPDAPLYPAEPVHGVFKVLVEAINRIIQTTEATTSSILGP
jgi:hypothetical protein